MATITGTIGPDDLLPVHGEDDIIDGLGDRDSVTYEAAAQGFVFRIAQNGTATSADMTEVDVIDEVELFIGTAFDDDFSVSGDEFTGYIDELGGRRVAIFGGGGRDDIFGNSGDDFLDGGADRDRLEGRVGDDTLLGQGGDDTLVGGLLTDVEIDILRGGDGDDSLQGGGGDDQLFGDDDNDLLRGGPGDDMIDGGAGIDDVTYSFAANGVAINLTRRLAVDDGDGGQDTLLNIENVIGTAMNDVIIGDAGENSLFGGDGDDRLSARGSSGDDLFGGRGDDIYDVYSELDQVFEGPGNGDRDRVNAFVDFSSRGNVEFIVGLFADQGLNLTGANLRERITGANRIHSPDTIEGNGGNDTLVGLVGDDVLNGGDGRDRIFGNSGADIITGGAGNDRVTGSFGADTFVFNVGDDRDRITDFNFGEDLLDVSDHGIADFDAFLALTRNIAGGALIELSGTDVILLEGRVKADIEMGDVLLV